MWGGSCTFPDMQHVPNLGERFELFESLSSIQWSAPQYGHGTSICPRSWRWVGSTYMHVTSPIYRTCSLNSRKCGVPCRCHSRQMPNPVFRVLFIPYWFFFGMYIYVMNNGRSWPSFCLSPSSFSMHIILLTLLSSLTFTYVLYPMQLSRWNTTRVIPPASYYNPLNNGGSFLVVNWVFTCFMKQLRAHLVGL